MKIEDIKQLSPIDRFCYFIQERESIRLKRLAGESPPWTDDEILQRFRFTNVRRMDDRVSQWLLKEWYEPNFDHPNMLVACAVARFINLPASLDLITKYVFSKRWGAGPSKRIKEVLRKRKASGETVFNAAYMVRGNDGVDKLESVMDFHIKSLKGLKIDENSMEATWQLIQDCYGFGSFMAGQVVADLRWAVSGLWSDRNDWAPMGPGSKRGINRLAGRAINAPLRQEQFLTELENLREACEKKLPTSITERLELHDWQNCCCEISKYDRTLFDGKRPKQLYRKLHNQIVGQESR